jgi:peptide-methionine (S)-S-oxide reductase
MTEERAVLAGGCFWGVQDLIRRYEAFCRHGSATPAAGCPTLRIVITAHMPKQSRSSLILPGSAIGRSSNSSSRFTTQARAIARATTSGPATDLRAEADCRRHHRRRRASGLWPGQVVTEVVPVGDFWEAEPEHQDYLQRYPGGYTCHFVRPRWRLPIRTDKVAKEA